MDNLRASGLEAAARKRVAPAPGAAAAAADVRARRSSWPQRVGAGDRRGAHPPRPPPPPRRGEGGGGAARDAGEAGGGARDARRGGAGKAEDDAGGGTGRGRGRGAGAARTGAAARAGPEPDAKGDDEGAAAVPAGGDGGASRVVAPREGLSGGSEAAGSKKRAFASSAAAAPRAYPPPKRRLVSAERHFPPGCGRGADGADGGSRHVTAAPARSGGGSAALPTKPAAAAAAARHPPRSLGEDDSGGVLEKAPAAVVPRPIVDAGRHGPRAAAGGLLGIDSQGRSGTGGFGSSKGVVRLLPKPRLISAIRCFPPGRGRVRASQPLNKSADTSAKTESKGSSTARGSFGPKEKLTVKGPDHLRLEAKSADKFPKTESKDSSPASSSFGPKKKLTVKGPDHVRLKVASACTMGSISKVDDLVAAILADDAFLKAEADYRRKLQLKLNVSSDSDARSKVKMIYRRFKFICSAIVQFVEQRSLKISRIDIAAGKVIKELPEFTQQGPVIGDVPGVEVGDEFVYRVELALVGLHRPHRQGIDSTKDKNGELVAISIVASGGYPDELSSSGELIYTGSGGKYAGKKSDENQKLKGGNLALKNCIQTMTPVRVIHGFKGSSKEEGSHSRAKGASAFTYDGLYHVVNCWIEGQAGSKMFKYKLLKIPGQPELPHSKTASGRKTGIMCRRRGC